MSATALTSTRELHRRVNDGTKVRPLWCERDGRLWVAVIDSNVREEFCVEVRDRERALDVFDHPYVCAAHHGIDSRATAADANVAMSLPV